MFLGVPDTMDRMTDDEAHRERVAQLVKRGRRLAGWSKEEAARRAGISSITWKRVEDAEPVRDLTMGVVLDTFDAADRSLLRDARRELGWDEPPTPAGLEDAVDLAGLTPRQREAVVSVVRAMLDPGSKVPDETGATTETKTGSVERQGSTKSRQRRSKAG